jgi:hypothetical protein
MCHTPGVDLPEVFRALSEADQIAAVKAVANEAAALHCLGRPDNEGVGPASGLASYGLKASTFGKQTAGAVERARIGHAHGDMGPWNIRYNPITRAVRIIDWEDYRPQGLPALDILNFVVTLPLLLYPEHAKERWDRLFDLAFCQSRKYRTLAKASLSAWAARTGSSARDTMALLPAFCAAMVARIEQEGRSSRGMFFDTFAERFVCTRLPWIESLDEEEW